MLLRYVFAVLVTLMFQTCTLYAFVIKFYLTTKLCLATVSELNRVLNGRRWNRKTCGVWEHWKFHNGRELPCVVTCKLRRQYFVWLCLPIPNIANRCIQWRFYVGSTPGGTGPQILPTPKNFLIGSIVISLSRCRLPNDKGPGPHSYIFPRTASGSSSVSC